MSTLVRKLTVNPCLSDSTLYEYSLLFEVIVWIPISSIWGICYGFRNVWFSYTLLPILGFFICSEFINYPKFLYAATIIFFKEIIAGINEWRVHMVRFSWRYSFNTFGWECNLISSIQGHQE